MTNWGFRAVISAAATTALALGVLAPTAHAAAESQMLLVHGWGNSSTGKDCNGSTWKNALDYYQDAGNRSRSSMSTAGYYEGDEKADSHGAGCDVVVGDGKATNERPIQDIAADLAHHIHENYTAKGESVDIVAHSMGGLVTRVALLGSAQDWNGFPPKLEVGNVVTLSTPHQGLSEPDAHSDRQWQQMRPGSTFMTRLHEEGSRLDDSWASGTDWSFVGSGEDPTVSYDSGIDKGYHADQKYGYEDDSGDSGEVDHQAVRELTSGAYSLRYWHASGDHDAHDATNGWAPLKTAFKAATNVGDDLPR